MNVRCVITGHDAAGKSIIARDELVAPKSVLGYEFHRLWGSDEHPSVPTDGKTPVPRMYFPSAQGYRFGFFVVPPNSDDIPTLKFMAALPEIMEKLPGMAEVMEPLHAGMHTTKTVDFDVVLSGEVWMEVDDGKEVLLKAGDCVVQNGTRHAWHNRSKEPCVIAVCLLGANEAAATADRCG